MQSWFTRMRKEKGLKQKQLSAACGYSAPTWIKLEEDPSLFKLKDLMIIAPHLDTSVENLVKLICKSSDSIQSDLEQTQEIPDILYTVAAAVARSGKTWREFGDIAEATSHSSARRNLESWINKSNEILSKLGYRIGIIKKD